MRETSQQDSKSKPTNSSKEQTTLTASKKRVKSIEQKIKDLEYHVAQINDRTKQSKVLNGGFDTLMFKVDAIAESQKLSRDEIAEIHKAVYDPETGLWVRVKANERDQKTIEQLHEEILKLKVFREEHGSDNRKFSEIETRLKEHKDYIESSTKTRQTIWSVFKWVGITVGSAAIGGLIKLIYDMFF